jgi:signal transduction histidine kinase
MPDRLVELYAQVARKVEDVDASLKSLLGKDAADRQVTVEQLRKDWGELLALVKQQGHMLGDIARRTQELSSLSAFLQTHYERENARLARELHDELGGILTPAKMDLVWLQGRLAGDAQYAERMTRLSALIDHGIDLKRRIIEDLHPSLLDHLGLASAVQWYVEETCRAAKLECSVKVSPKLERLSPDLEIALYRIVQESLTNVVRHAKATHVEVAIDRDKKGLRVEIRDDGTGIGDLERARKLSHGLAGMSQRMRAIDGTFDVHSSSGKGTRIAAFVPLGG